MTTLTRLGDRPPKPSTYAVRPRSVSGISRFPRHLARLPHDVDASWDWTLPAKYQDLAVGPLGGLGSDGELSDAPAPKPRRIGRPGTLRSTVSGSPAPPRRTR